MVLVKSSEAVGQSSIYVHAKSSLLYTSVIPKPTSCVATVLTSPSFLYILVYSYAILHYTASYKFFSQYRFNPLMTVRQIKYLMHMQLLNVMVLRTIFTRQSLLWIQSRCACMH